jgi:hypothetical protein
MWGRLGPRFAVEAAFLILLAVGLGLADQSWVVIVAVMAGGWALVSLIELVASRRATTQWSYARDAPAEEPALAEEPAEPALPPEPAEPELAQPPVVPIEAAAAPSAPAPGPAPMPAEPAPPPEAAPADVGEDTMEVAAPEADEARPRRRWFRRRRSVEDPDDLVPEPVKHVRRLDTEQVEEPSHAESAEHRT